MSKQTHAENAYKWAIFLVHQLARKLAIAIDATEFSAFLVTDEKPEANSLANVVHGRRDTCDNKTAAAAIKSFKAMLVECLKEKRGGYYEVKPGMWCLMELLYEKSDNSIKGAVAFIVYTTERSEVIRRMKLITGGDVFWR